MLAGTTTQLLARRTSILVPIAYYALLHKGTTCFGMERLKGNTVRRVWLLKMGDSKHHMLEQLAGMTAEN